MNKSFLLLIFLSLFLGACVPKEEKFFRKLSKEDPRDLEYKGKYKIGKEYIIKNETYKPKEYPEYKAKGVASWYGGKFHNKKSAGGHKFNKRTLTAAHRELPLPSLVKVTNLSNKKSIILMITDRGPFAGKERIIDVSERAAEILGFKMAGIANVEIEYLPKETKALLDDMGLKGKGRVKNTKLSKNRCSVNCRIKLVNLKNNLKYE